MNDALLGFTLGLGSAAHCAAMCGVFALHAAGGRGAAPGVLIYLLGKTFTYLFLGALAGAAGGALARHPVLPSVLGGLAGTLLLLAGARQALGWRSTGRTSGWMAGLFRPVHSALGLAMPGGWMGRRFAWGVASGALPCGVVYLAALQAGALGDARQAVLFMAAFGAGTAPVLLLTGCLGRAALGRFGGRRLELVGGVLVAVAGAVTLFRLLPSADGSCAACLP